MKLLLINTNPICADGITNVILNHYRTIDKQGMHIDLMAINDPEDAIRQLFREHGGEIFVLQRSFRHPLRYILALSRIVRKGGYDLIHAHGNSSTLALEMIAAWLGGCKVRIAHSHNTSCKFMAAHRLLKPIFRMLCTHRLACGTDAGKWLFGNQKFAVINNGIDTQRFRFSQDARDRLREEFGLKLEQKLIGHVGIFNKTKNQTFLVDILEKLLRQSNDYRLMLLGEGSMRSQIEEKVAQLGLTEQVVFVGVTNRVPDYLSACDLIVMPSLHEGLPLALIEEQVNGLQCIVSDTITREADKTGNLIFLPLEDGVQRWAQAVQKLELPEDRQAVSVAATENIKACGYDIHSEAAKLKAYYECAVREAGKKN